jgi:hypothetical protein
MMNWIKDQYPSDFDERECEGWGDPVPPKRPVPLSLNDSEANTHRNRWIAAVIGASFLCAWFGDYWYVLSPAWIVCVIEAWHWTVVSEHRERRRTDEN